jgi:predicted porin
MKKTLVALAAIASVSAFAQTTVSITGNLDMAGARFGGTMTGNKGITTFTTDKGTSSTSAINIIATEDIGGGNSVTAFFGLDPRSLADNGLGSTNNVGSAATSPNAVTATGLGRHEVYVQTTGAFGTIKMGAPNSISLNVVGDATPMGTSMGSGYSASSNTQLSRIAPARYSRSVRYDSPAMNGLTASLLFAPGADTSAVDAAGSAYAAFLAPNARRVNEIGLKYSNGPLNVSFFNQSQSTATNYVGWYGTSDTSSAAVYYGATKYNFASANYKFGDTTVYAGAGTGQEVMTYAAAGSLYSTKTSRFALKHTIGNLDLMATQTKLLRTVQSGTTTLNENITGFQALYNLSKTSAAYLGYEKYDTGTVASTANTTSGTRNITSIGLRKSF